MNEKRTNEEEKTPEYYPRRWILAFAGTVLLGLLMLFYIFTWPHREIGPQQPIPFSHRVHAGTKQIACRFCHSFPDYGPRSGLPTVAKCFFCHQYVIPLHPEIKNERRYLDSGQPVLWKRVFYLPDYVQFNHQPHVRWAQLDCTQCHGQVQTYDRLVVKRFKMGFCIDCHRRLNAQVDCWLACHH